MKDTAENAAFDGCRWDPFNRRWVVVSSRRRFRPGKALGFPDLESTPGECPFCPRNEAQTPPPRYLDRDPAQDEFPWRVRVVDNLFGALGRRPVQAGDGLTIPPGSEWTPARGIHEIIIETPVHDRQAADYSDEEMTAVLRAYRSRLQAAWSEPGVAYATIFKNHGREAGASLEHGHSQLIALPFVPPSVHRPAEHCLLCAVIEAERQGPRAVATRNALFAWAPYPAAFPYETWIAPADHTRDFLTADDAVIYPIAVLLRDVLRALRSAAGNVAYNLVFQVAPPHREGLTHPWRIEIIPRTTRLAGLEMGTGTFINPLAPELSARSLRQEMAELGYSAH